MSEKLAIEITGIRYEIDEKTKKYVEKKCGKLIDYIPRKARESAFANVKIEQMAAKSSDKYAAEIVLTLPDKVLVARETAPNALAGIDICEEKLRGQIRRYKTERKANEPRGIKAILRRMRR